MIEYRKHITRAMLKAEPEKLFVFGDNIHRKGYGGQAKEMRDEPNAVGIPTKVYPSMDEGAFFIDEDFPVFVARAAKDFLRLSQHIGPIVWPKDGIGTGRAQLKERAPKIWFYIEAQRLILENDWKTTIKITIKLRVL